MIPHDHKIYLASKSPRRRHLLSLLNINFEGFSVDLDENIEESEHPEEAVTRLADHKMEAAKKIKDNGIIITADTIVVLDGEIIGKPVDGDDACKILKKLSGNTHTVYTGFAIYNYYNDNLIIDFEKTEVTFRELQEDEIRKYVAGGSPMDKAGAYGIQDDFGAVFVEKINGCYYNVVGLPLSKLYSRLKEII